MSYEKCNALAELAERLDGIADVFIDEETTRFDDVRKSQRIVAELAKCGDHAPPESWEPEWHLHPEDARRCVERCRKIAEEGNAK